MAKKIKECSRRLLYPVIAVIMVLGLLLAPAAAPPVSAAEVNAEWGKVDTPFTDDWTIAPGSVINVIASSFGGSVVILVGSGYEENDISNPRTPRIWRSEDSGMTWDDITDNVLQAEGLPAGNITEFNYVVMPQLETDFVAVAAKQTGEGQIVLLSDDRGETFAWSGPLKDVTAGTNVTEILSMVVSGEHDGKHTIVAGGYKFDPFGTPHYKGLVYRYETGGLTGGHWVDASNPDIYEGWDNRNDGDATNDLSSEAVSTVVITGDTVLAVSPTANATYLQSGTLGDITAWNLKAGFEQAVEITDDHSWWHLGTGAATGIALPLDYDSRHADSRYAWVYVDRVSDGEGIIYRVKNDDVAEVTQQIPGHPFLATISYFGTIAEGKAIAGLMGTGGTIEAGPLLLPDITDCGEGVQVYRNDGISDMDICCQRWEEACKPPTGRMAALVAYVSPAKAYCAVIGVVEDIGGPFFCEEGGLSFSIDDGDTWNQIGLVNTHVDYLSDVAKSANCNKTWVVSVNVNCPCHNLDDQFNIVGNATCDSVWLKADPLPEASEYSGAWIREWCKELTPNATLNSAQTPEMGLLRLAPEETEEALTVYLVDRGTDTVYYDSTEGLGCWETGSSTVDEISDLAVQDEATIYALGFNADVAVSDDHGSAASWSSTMDSNVDEGHTIAVLGEGNVLVGGDDGKVSYSDSDLATFLDGDASFTELDDIGDGRVHVAFDSYFDTNSKVYAAVSVVNATEYPVNDPDNGIYRWVIDESSSWTDLGECAGAATPYAAQLGYDTCNETQVGYYGIILSNAEGNPETDAITGGVLYATFYDEDGNVTGVARCLNPAEEVACGGQSWDYLIQGMAEDAAFTLEPSSLKICGCLTPDTNARLWAIDDHPYYADLANGTAEDDNVGRLWTYEDCFAKAGPTLNSPADNAVVDADPCYCWNDAFTLKWERQCDACSYNLQISRDADFTEVVLDISGKDGDCLEYDYEPPSGTSPSYVVANGALGTGSCGTTFYWRVRSADAETDEIIHSWWSEVRSFTVATGPGAAVTLTNPSNGAIGVAVTGIPFTWDAVADATGYEFSMVKADGTDVVSATAVSGTTYTYTGTLSYNTSYYWTVKALKDSVVFGQATATFTTGAEKAVPPAPTTASWLWVIIGIGAVVWLVILVLIFRTRRV